MKGIKYIAGVLTLVVLGLGVIACGGNAERISQLEEQLEACESKKGATEGAAVDLAEGKMQAQVNADDERRLAASRAALVAQLKNQLKSLIDNGQVRVVSRRGLTVIELSNKLTFATGKAEVSEDGKKALADVADVLKATKDRGFLIGGHTDNAKVTSKTKLYTSNWELSAARATAVHDILKTGGLDASKMTVAGFGESDPIGDNGTDEGKAMNRRTEIIVIPDLNALMMSAAM